MITSESQTNENPNEVLWKFCEDECIPKNDGPFIVTDGEGFFSIGYTNWLYRTPEGQLKIPAHYGRGMDVNYWMLVPESLMWTLCNEQRPPKNNMPYIFDTCKGDYVIGYSHELYETEGKCQVRGHSKMYVTRWAALPLLCEIKKIDQKSVMAPNVYKVEFYIEGIDEDAGELRRNLAQSVSDEFSLHRVFGVTVCVDK